MKGFGKVGFGVPYFRPGYEFWLWWSQMLIDGFETGDVFLNDGDVPGEVPIPVAHNALVREFLKTDCDTLLIIEDDHSGEPELVRGMRQKTENWAFDIVCASYVGRRGMPKAMGWTFGTHDEDLGWQLRINNEGVELSGTQEYDGAGLGCVLIRRQVIELMLDGRDPDTFLWFNWDRHNSQDVWFYNLAREIGARVGVDRDNWLLHWGKYPWGKNDFDNWRERGRAEIAARNGAV